MAVSRPRRRTSARTQRIARRLPFGLCGGWLEQASDGAHVAAHIRDGGADVRIIQVLLGMPASHGALHPGRHPNDQQHAEPARSAPLDNGAEAYLLRQIDKIRKAQKAESKKPASRKKLELVNAKDVIMRPVNWLWRGHVACGEQELMTGMPAVGKSTIHNAEW
jgi:hypothetical protein